jgi:hypothetical protein
MNDDALLPDWDRDPATRAGLEARLQEMLLQHTADDPRWPQTVAALAEDLVSCDQVAEALSSVCTYVDNLVVYHLGGRQEAVDRFASDLEQLCALAAKGYPMS